MDIQAMASQLMSFLSDNPNLISQFVEHPYSTTAQATNTNDTISKDDMSQILTQVAAQTVGQSFSAGDMANIASSLLGQNGNSIHALTNSLFGGAAQPSSSSSATNAPSMAQIAINSALGGLAARGMAQVFASALGGNKKGAKK